MSSRFGLDAAVKAINTHGALLVFPLENKKEPRSLWHEFHPRSQMKWEWNETGDNRVADLWQLREKLSRSGQVVYSKWYKGRATFFAKDVFSALLHLMQTRERVKAEAIELRPMVHEGLRIRSAAGIMLEALEMDSPLSTKQLKEVAELKGKSNERIFTRATQELWRQFLIAGFGEIDDGAFPSLAVGATRVLFETEYDLALKMSDQAARAILHKRLPPPNPFRVAFEKNWSKNFVFTPVSARAGNAASTPIPPRKTNYDF